MPSTPTFVLEILSASRNGITGHRSFTAQIIEISEDGKTETTGVPETHGIDTTSLQTQFGGAGATTDDWVAAWRDSVKAKMLARYQAQQLVDNTLTGMVGKRY
jgi:hypothetical protein